MHSVLANLILLTTVGCGPRAATPVYLETAAALVVASQVTVGIGATTAGAAAGVGAAQVWVDVAGTTGATGVVGVVVDVVVAAANITAFPVLVAQS